MNNDEWQQIGEDIRRQVQEAVDAGDFSRLSKTISDTVGLAIDGVGKSLNDVVDGVGKSINEAVGGVEKSLNVTSRQRDIRRMKPNLRPDRRFFGKPGGGVLGSVLMALGIGLCGIAIYTTFISMMAIFFWVESLEEFCKL